MLSDALILREVARGYCIVASFALARGRHRFCGGCVERAAQILAFCSSHERQAAQVTNLESLVHGAPGGSEHGAC